MSNQKEQMKWVLFWVFLGLFIIMVLGTLSIVFLGAGSPTESERELMVKGLIIEVAACIIALFYSIFGLKGQSDDNVKIEELEGKIERALTSIEALKMSNMQPSSSSPPTGLQEDLIDLGDAIQMNGFEATTAKLGAEPAFPVKEYELTPLPIEIKNDINSTKPIDVNHRKSSFKGMKVQWRATLFSVEERNESTLRIMADLDDRLMYAVFDINKNANNRLLLADKGEPFWLCGEIVGVETHRIEMSEVQIKFADQIF